MATNTRGPQRTRLPQRGKNDENAASRHIRQHSASSRLTQREVNGVKLNLLRPALGEVTLKAVNRKENTSKSVLGDKEDLPLKPARPVLSTTTVQRVPLGPARAQVAPPVANAVNARVPIISAPRPHIPILSHRRVPRIPPPPVVIYDDPAEDVEEEAEDDMDIEDVPVHALPPPEQAQVERERDEDEMSVEGEEEVEAMIVVEDREEAQEEETETPQVYVWPDAPTHRRLKYAREVEAIREVFEDDPDYDPAMVAEYADEIFEYMQKLEEEVMPNPDYMDSQQEITWEMRQTLVDWLLQAHLRYHMIPETVWIAINIVDRFLSKRVVSLARLQLVGISALFIAAKYEEIMAPSVDEFVAMAENGYTRDEVLKGERIILQTLGFHISHYCSPYSWMRKISRADDYEIQTRTLCKFLVEATLLDYRFLRAKPSLVAAVGMYTSRIMLGGDWNEAFVFHSGFTEEQLVPGHELLIEKIAERSFARLYLVKKYANKKFLKASTFAIKWARGVLEGTGCTDTMLRDDQV